MEYRSVTGPAPLSAVVSAAGPALFVALSEDLSSLCIFDDGEAAVMRVERSPGLRLTLVPCCALRALLLRLTLVPSFSASPAALA